MKNKIIILSFLAVTLLSAFFAKNVIVSNIPATYLPKDMPSNVLNAKLRQQFGSDELFIFMFQLEEFSKESLSKFQAVVERAKKIENIKEIRSIFDHEVITGDSDAVYVKKEFDIDNFETELKELENDEVAKDLYLDYENKILTLVVEPNLIGESLERHELKTKVETEFKNLSASGATLIGIAGELSVDTHQFEEMLDVLTLVVPLTSIFSMGVIFFLFRSIGSIIVLQIGSTAVTAICIGLYGAFSLPYNMVSTMIPSLMMAITISFFIHLLNHSEDEDSNSYDAAAKKVFRPTFYSGVTTSIGLFALAASPIPPIRFIGLVGGVGVIGSVLFTLFVAPILLSLFKVKLKKKSFNDALMSKLDILISTVLNAPRRTAAFMLSLLLIFGYMGTYVESESSLYEFFPKDHALNRGNNLFKKHFVGTTPIDISLKVEDGSLLNADRMRTILGMQEELEKLEDVTKVYSFANILRTFHNKFSLSKFDQASNEMLEQYLFIYDGQDLYDFMDRDAGLGRINLSLTENRANLIERQIEKVEQIIKNTNLDGIKVALAGSGKLFSDQENLLIGGFTQGFVLSFGLVSLCLILLFKSLGSGLLMMVPNLSPIVMCFGFMGIFNIWLDFGTAMISSLTLGIAVDDTIHMFHSMKKNIELHGIDKGIRMAYRESGTSITMTTFILCTQFMLLVFSEFLPLKNFGFITSIGLFSALVFDLVFLPALMKINHEGFLNFKNKQTV